MYLAFDTETTDITQPHLAPDHPAQPHLLQFAGILFDENGNELDRLITKVKPGDRALLSRHAYAAHGISLQEAIDTGVELSVAYRWFLAAADRTDLIVGHNVQFDLQIMAIAAARLGEIGWFPRPTFCTMARSTNLVNLPPTQRMIAAGRNHPKSPSLTECIRHFFGEKLTGAHDAEADVRACVRIFRHLTSSRGTV